jgi:hypothetical protein
MATLIGTEPAVDDLEEIGLFISKDYPLAAEKVGSKIIQEVEKNAWPNHRKELQCRRNKHLQSVR